MTQSEKGLSREPLTLKLRTEQPIKQLRALSEFNCYVERAVKIFIRTEIYLASGRVLKCCEKNTLSFTMIVYKATVCFMLVFCCPIHLLLTNFAEKVQSNQEKGNEEASLSFT